VKDVDCYCAMLRILSRRAGLRTQIPASLQILFPKPRYASTTQNSEKPTLVHAIQHPAPSVLSRWLLPRFPRTYWTAKFLIAILGMSLGFHIFTEYFFLVGESYGISMLPTLNSTGDWLIMSKHYRRGRGVEVGDLVSFKHPMREDTRSVKRVIGMSGDFVLRDSPDTSGVMIQVGHGRQAHGRHDLTERQVPEGHCYVVGDNLKYSRDSRMFGPLPLALVKGRVIGRFSFDRPWPEFFERGLNPTSTDEDAD